MRIINTEDKLIESKSRIPKSQTKILFGIWKIGICHLFLICCLVLGILPSCVQRSESSQAQSYAQQSQAYYGRAVKLYKDLIAQGKDLDKLQLQLGRLHYAHADFNLAIEVFKKLNSDEAKKFLAISYYRMGNFTDALEVFTKNEITDSEYLYYYGLTCEKLNLFDRALEVYNKIKEPNFSLKAKERINLIERQANLTNIKDLSPHVAQILKSAPSAQEYPQAGALILFCDEKIETTVGGTQISYLHYIIKILNERGKESFSETHIDYDSTYEKVELEFARTIKPDGTVVDVGSRHIRDVSKYLNFPLYSNVRVYIISFPEIAEGVSIEYKVKIHRNELINKKDFVINYPMQSSEPIIAANFNVVFPKAKTLRIKILNEKYNNFSANLNPVVKEETGYSIYSWQFKNIPQIIPETNMPEAVRINPTILLSTFNNWQDIYNWWWKLAKDKIKADAAIKNKVKELTKSKYSDEAKVRAIYNFCAQEIRYVAVEYGQAGYEPHYASDIFKNKYGDCKDQAILLVTMLREAGIASSPLLISTKAYYNLHEDFPSVLFNHCIAAVYLKDKVIFLDPTAQTCSFGDLPPDDQDRKVLIFNTDGYKIQDTPLYPAGHNLVKEELSLKINNDETIEAEKSIFTYGFYDQAQRYWLLYTQPELIQEELKETIQGISIGAKLLKYSIENLENLNKPVVLRYAFKGSEYLTSAGSLRIMPQLAGLDTALVAKDKRKYAIDFGVLDMKDTILEVEIPENFFIIKYIPKSIAEDSPWLKLTVEYKHNKNKIYFRQETQIKKREVLENEYPDFKRFLEGLAKKIKQRIVLERQAKK